MMESFSYHILFPSPFFSCSVLNDSECINLTGRLILIHECLNILYPLTVQKGPVVDGFSFPLSDFITHFLMPFYACSSLILSLPSSEYFEVFHTLCLVKDVYVGHKLFSHLNKNRVHLLTGGSSCFIH